MKKVKRLGDLPKALHTLLKDWKPAHKMMASMAKESLPMKPPELWECTGYEQVIEKTTDDTGTPVLVYDEDTEKFFAVGLCFGRRLSQESMKNPTERQEETWRTMVYFAEMDHTEMMAWRANYNKDKKNWMQDEKIRRDKAAAQKQQQRKLKQEFDKDPARGRKDRKKVLKTYEHN